jgi:hypothetical protein
MVIAWINSFSFYYERTLTIIETGICGNALVCRIEIVSLIESNEGEDQDSEFYVSPTNS